MRFQDPYPPCPEIYTFDVAISQTIGLQANGLSIRTKPTGGSEFQVVLLAESLAATGLRVAVISPIFAFGIYNGVTYIPHHELAGREDAFGVRRPSAHVQTEVLISERFGLLPPGVDFQRLVVDLHDLPDERLDQVMALLQDVKGSQVVVHSEFLKSLLTGWPNITVIPCMVPESFYGQPRPVRLDGKGKAYVYGSAALKGLEPTLALWNELKRSKSYHFKHARLTVTSPGYDTVDHRLLAGAKDVSAYSGLSPSGMQALLAASDGLFMASTYPETFGIVMAQAEIAGVPAHVLQLHGVDDALQTTLANPCTLYREPAAFIAGFGDRPELAPAKDYRVSTHLPSWLKVLGLKQQEQAA